MIKKKTSKIIDGLLENLPKRSREIITRRYGLEKNSKAETLDAIGQTYGITRERVRQIESVAKKLIRKTEIYDKEAAPLAGELKKDLEKLGGVLKLDDFFDNISVAKDEKDHIYFIIDITEEIDIEGPTKDFHQMIHLDKKKRDIAKKSTELLYKKIGSEEILTEKEIISKFLDKIEEEMKTSMNKKSFSKEDLNSENLKRILRITKKISSNTLGGWGRKESKNISAKGIKDLAYLTLREHEKPLYFKDIVSEIYKKFDRKINPATCHNELIRDKRFILVGRGIYGLKEWNKFDGGTVSDVIVKILKNAKKPLLKKEIIEKVLKKKFVKEQTIMINLGNKKIFSRDSDGKYSLV